MPDVHLPALDDEKEVEPASVPERRRSKSVVKVLFEVLLISTGVFLGLLGEQWRESTHHRELALDSLRRFRAEIVSNRTAVLAVKDYHAVTRKDVETYLAADRDKRRRSDLSIKGIQPVSFEHTAWDLAIATQSLAYLDAQLAFNLARVYDRQQLYTELTHGALQAMYLRPPSENLDAFLPVLALYYDDIVLEEPGLVSAYDELLPQIDQALAR
jgi:hypothetical protein